VKKGREGKTTSGTAGDKRLLGIGISLNLTHSWKKKKLSNGETAVVRRRRGRGEGSLRVGWVERVERTTTTGLEGIYISQITPPKNRDPQEPTIVRAREGGLKKKEGQVEKGLILQNISRG